MAGKIITEDAVMKQSDASGICNFMVGV